MNPYPERLNGWTRVDTTGPLAVYAADPHPRHPDWSVRVGTVPHPDHDDALAIQLGAVEQGGDGSSLPITRTVGSAFTSTRDAANTLTGFLRRYSPRQFDLVALVGGDPDTVTPTRRRRSRRIQRGDRPERSASTSTDAPDRPADRRPAASTTARDESWLDRFDRENRTRRGERR